MSRWQIALQFRRLSTCPMIDLLVSFNRQIKQRIERQTLASTLSVEAAAKRWLMPLEQKNGLNVSLAAGNCFPPLIYKTNRNTPGLRDGFPWFFTYGSHQVSAKDRDFF